MGQADGLVEYRPLQGTQGAVHRSGHPIATRLGFAGQTQDRRVDWRRAFEVGEATSGFMGAVARGIKKRHPAQIPAVLCRKCGDRWNADGGDDVEGGRDSICGRRFFLTDSILFLVVGSGLLQLPWGR